MTVFRTLTPDVLVAGQIDLDDLIEARARGVRVVVSNRPDGEEPGQISAAEIGAAAESAGMTFVHAPVRGFPDGAAVQAVEQALSIGEPVLMFCRSGMRSAAAWAISAHRAGASRDEIVAAGANAGYDLSNLPIGP